MEIYEAHGDDHDDEQCYQTRHLMQMMAEESPTFVDWISTAKLQFIAVNPFWWLSLLCVFVIRRFILLFELVNYS